MAPVSAAGNNVFSSPDLDPPVEVTAIDTSALEVDMETPDKVATDDNARDSPYADGGVLTPNSTTASVSRTPGSDTGRRKEVVRKPRRVRTGCLTCRERHLKCDEALHQCQNCRKSGRLCRRGIRLNFIDTQTVAPPHYIRPPSGSHVTFRDDSRHIASEYVGGFERYPPPEADPPLIIPDLTSPPLSSPYNVQATSSATNGVGAAPPTSINGNPSSQARHSLHSFQDHSASYAPFNSAKRANVASSGYACLNNPDDFFLLQVFVDEIGQWMDSMNDVKHFSHILPFHALEQPMLSKAFMACGARHVFLKNASYGDEKASFLHDAASRDLLGSLQDPDRDSALCATTAVVLNVYEMMCSRSFPSINGMNHIAGARALIKECRWDARTHGLGGVCFWLNATMELLSCLHFNWSMAWDPDTWGVNMEFGQAQPSVAGNEELWTHRIIYICAKVANFRSALPPHQALDHAIGDMQINKRCQEWNMYNEWCDKWAKAVPRSMVPLAYLQPWQTNSKSVFPNIWLIKRSSILARLFYHTARILLTKSHPVESEFSPEMQSVQQSHAHDICGIVAHIKDRGFASLSIRFLALAAECLVTREAQEEMFELLDIIAQETGWRAEDVKSGLQQTWGWNATQEQHPVTADPDALSLLNDPHAFSLDPSSTLLKMPPGVVNPILAFSDFSTDPHPYGDSYVAPHQISQYQCGGL
ncbi:hypothetical protein BDV25DRAFT_44680 [Aspergillus avenaceus]|uniref:Zn(2)-C6 fungal-type domain-containing protein n=1 Tax=Aspergillus avenaceus TaxID=36643 RepID=A0A5N6TKG8_ASPAV|nr:hypothetical protein BDV25DRAFT_44680 [Aspergillus avenaceus]